LPLSAAHKLRHPVRRGLTWIIEPADIGAAADTRAFDRSAHQHPILRYYEDHPEERGRALKLSDFLSPKELRQLTLYGEFFWSSSRAASSRSRSAHCQAQWA
jgi:hypothetical protein